MEHLLQRLAHDTFDELDGMLEKTIEFSGAQKGTLQIYDPQKGLLHIISQNGFGKDFLEHFKYVKPFDGSACGRAAGTGNVVSINDITQDVAFKSHRETALAEGVWAVLAVPLFHDDRLVGVLAVHFNEPKQKLRINTFTNTVASDIAKVLDRIIKIKEQPVMH